MSNKALIVIDLQNDYFPGGKYPLWNTEKTLENILKAISEAQEKNIPVIFVQHIANKEMGVAPFFNEATPGADIYPEALKAAPDAKIVIKEFADSFEKTELDEVLQNQQIDELLICGMMTQNCVTHTAISKAAEKYKVSVLFDCCTTVDEMLHNIAIHAVSTRVTLTQADNAI